MASSSEPTIIEIRGRALGAGLRPLVIADISRSHDASAPRAERLLRLAHALGADAVRFGFLGNENVRLTADDFRRLAAVCHELEISYVAAVRDDASMEMAEMTGADCCEVRVDSTDDVRLLRHVAEMQRPTIIAMNAIDRRLLHCAVDEILCVATPAALLYRPSDALSSYESIDLGVVRVLTDELRAPVGFSDSSRGIYTALGAVALGASFIEKTLTLDGPDGPPSLGATEFGELIKGVRAVFEANGAERIIFPEERQILAWARESVVSEVAIPRGTRIATGMVWVKRPAPESDSVPAKDLQRVVGRTAAVDIAAGRQIKWADLQ